PRLPPPPELRGACGRAACAPRRSARRRLSSVTAEPRACPPRIRRWPSGRRPDKRGGRDERLEGQEIVAGRKGRQRGGAQAADRPWSERPLAQSWERRMVSSVSRGILRRPRDRQAPSQRGRRCDSSKQVGRDCHRHRTGAGQERGRGPAERGSVRRADEDRPMHDCQAISKRRRIGDVKTRRRL
ncbi:hypothetical protein Ctob_016069, partial [Chrysochromulina tobinii]